MLLSPKQFILCVAILANLIVSMSFTKTPINADFVNGLWARIGKRARADDAAADLLASYEIKCDDPSKLDLNTYLANCIDNQKDGNPQILKHLKLYLTQLNFIYFFL